ncbi:TPA: hypothetical protein ACM7DI_004767, partial [Escherichia coli]
NLEGWQTIYQKADNNSADIKPNDWLCSSFVFIPSKPTFKFFIKKPTNNNKSDDKRNDEYTYNTK